MQVTPIINLLKQASPQVKEAWNLRFGCKPLDLTAEGRQAAFEWLYQHISGNLYVLFTVSGSFTYAMGESPMEAAAYVLKTRIFRAVWWTLERTISLGGSRKVSVVLEAAKLRDQWIVKPLKKIKLPPPIIINIDCCPYCGAQHMTFHKLDCPELLKSMAVVEAPPADPSAMRDTLAIQRRPVAQLSTQPTAAVVDEHPLQRVASLPNAWGR